MRCIIAIFLAALCFIAAVSEGYAFPAEEPNTLFDELTAETSDGALENLRAKRATCDLLSGLGLNHSACAAHCILKRRKGGYCNAKAVCVCRN